MIFTAWPAYEVSFENVQIADLERLIVYAPSLVELDIPHRENGQRLSVIVPNEVPNYRSLGDTNIVELDKLVQDMFKNDPPRFREYYNESKRFREFLLNEISQDTLNKLNIDLETS